MLTIIYAETIDFKLDVIFVRRTRLNKAWKALLFTLAVAAPAVGQIKEKEQQIEEAVLPLPEALRADAKVIRYDADAKHSVLREGTNGWICVTDDPTEGFTVGCHHESFHSFRQRRRELLADGKSRDEMRSIRAAEVKSEDWNTPTWPAVCTPVPRRRCASPDGESDLFDSCCSP